MTFDALYNKAQEQGMVEKEEFSEGPAGDSGWITFKYRSTRVSAQVSKGTRTQYVFHHALRDDVRLDLATKITRVSDLAKILHLD